MKIYLTILILLVAGQLVYSFFLPSCGLNDNWLPISSYLPKFESQGSDNFFVAKLLPLVPEGYRLNSDVGNYIELALNFNRQYFQGHVFMGRPLYPFLIAAVSLPFRLFLGDSYGVIFASAILLNFLLLSGAVILFFYFLRSLFSLRIAFFSSVLLIFSPFVHVSLWQPMAEMLMLFTAALSAFLLSRYIKKPALWRLILFSFIIGALMLGKMFFAVSFFILLLALYFRRYKEGIIFLAVQFLPLLLWYLWVTKIWVIPYYSAEIQHWGMGVWIFALLKGPWFETFRTLLTVVPNFLKALIYGFLLIPVIFSAIGWRALAWKDKAVFYFAPFLAIMGLEFLVNLYSPHHAFLLFPLIYPTAILGMDKAADVLKRHRWPAGIFYAFIFAAIIIVSSMDIYKVFSYLYFV